MTGFWNLLGTAAEICAEKFFIPDSIHSRSQRTYFIGLTDCGCHIAVERDGIPSNAAARCPMDRGCDVLVDGGMVIVASV